MQVSKKKIESKFWQGIWESIWIFLQKRKRISEFEKLFSMILAKTEKEMMAKRLMIGVLGFRGISAHKIAEILKLSPATVYKYLVIYRENEDFENLIKNVNVNFSSMQNKEAKNGLIDALIEGRTERWKVWRED